MAEEKNSVLLRQRDGAAPAAVPRAQGCAGGEVQHFNLQPAEEKHVEQSCRQVE